MTCCNSLHSQVCQKSIQLSKYRKEAERMKRGQRHDDPGSKCHHARPLNDIAASLSEYVNFGHSDLVLSHQLRQLRTCLLVSSHSTVHYQAQRTSHPEPQSLSVVSPSFASTWLPPLRV